jgi:hypothetical protein
LVVLELKASHFVVRYSTTWAMPLVTFVLVILEIRSCFCPGWPGPQLSYFTLPTITGMTGVCHHAKLFSTEMRSHTFLPGLSWNYDPPDFDLPQGLDCQALISRPSYWLRWDLANFCLDWLWTAILPISKGWFQRRLTEGINPICMWEAPSHSLGVWME